MNNPLVSIIILTFQRPLEIARNVEELLLIDYYPFEIIVVNNGDPSDLDALPDNDDRLKIINMDKNIGVGARNEGIRNSSGRVIVTLDDDVFGLSGEDIRLLLRKFNSDESLYAINVKVIDDSTEQQVNWMHHKKIEEYGNVEFDTYEISEGAVAFRRDLILKTELYPEFFFISHEGPDLALQIIKMGGRLIYYPSVIVRHSHAEGGRLGWRNYYYDTRNQIWLAARHYPLDMAVRKLLVGLGSMFLYSLRDGFLLYFFKGCSDGVRGYRRARLGRRALSGDARQEYLNIEKTNPSLWYMVKRRVFKSGVKI